MSKLSKQDKIEIYHLWHDYQIGSTELSQRYRVGKSNISYLLALVNRHGLAILDQPFTNYTSNFKEQALKRVIVDHVVISGEWIELEDINNVEID